ncbi:MAG: HAMP domain-containing sensor histidine kinase [Planctomycetota bacterium]
MSKLGVFLPSVGFHESAWRLPLHPTSVIAVGMALTADPEDTASRRLDTLLQRALAEDSALLLFTTLQHGFDCFHPSRLPRSCEIALDDLVNWWCQQGRSVFLSDDLVPLNDVDDASTVDERTAERLWAYFQTRPLRTRLANADLWLAAVGAEPPSQLQSFLSGVAIRAGSEASHDDQPVDVLEHPGCFLARVAKQAESLERLQRRFESEQQRCRQDLARSLAYGMSHEVNNPLTSIVARAEGLLNAGCSEEHATSLKRIVGQAYRAYGMIADLMFLGNPPTIQIAPVACHEIVERAVDSVTDQARDQHTEIQLNATEAIVECDGALLADALTALLRNSLQAIASGGRIQITASQVEDTLMLQVADSGPGLTSEQRSRAFDPFYSGREAGRGLGLGLARVNTIVQLHGGQVEIRSAVAGCVVEMRLPTERE